MCKEILHLALATFPKQVNCVPAYRQCYKKTKLVKPYQTRKSCHCEKLMPELKRFHSVKPNSGDKEVSRSHKEGLLFAALGYIHTYYAIKR